MHDDYSPAVRQLLTDGPADAGLGQPWPDYQKLGITEAHIPELIQLATDEELLWADSHGPEALAPIHACRALGQLQAEAAIEPLTKLLDHDADWILEELPLVFGEIGPAAIPVLVSVLSDTTRWLYARVPVTRSLEVIGNVHPEARADSVKALTNQLARYTDNEPSLNGFLVAALLDLEASESIDTIRSAFAAECVDISITGDLEDAERELGFRASRSTPQPSYHDLPEPPSDSGTAPMAEDSATSHEPFVREKPKIGRNDPCPCGSGKKYKQCCLN